MSLGRVNTGRKEKKKKKKRERARQESRFLFRRFIFVKRFRRRRGPTSAVSRTAAGLSPRDESPITIRTTLFFLLFSLFPPPPSPQRFPTTGRARLPRGDANQPTLHAGVISSSILRKIYDTPGRQFITR